MLLPSHSASHVLISIGRRQVICFVFFPEHAGCSRGYREGMHRSPLNEAAAAGLLLLSGWQHVCEQRGGRWLAHACWSRG